MKIPESVIRFAHRHLCGTNPGTSEGGCCGCGADHADVYVATCEYCGGGYESFCWQCIDTWPFGAEPLTAADYTVYPGHERSAA